MSANSVLRPVMPMRMSLYEHHAGVETEDGRRVAYDVLADEAHFGAARVDGPAIVWEIGGDGADADTSVLASIPMDDQWLVRCDRVDFPPSGVAHRHVHPGPGIRRLLFGQLTIASLRGSRTYSAGEAWFEGRDEPVLATASAEATAFVRVLLLPLEWAGKRTIRYLDPADEEKPKLQRASVLLEEPIEL